MLSGVGRTPARRARRSSLTSVLHLLSARDPWQADVERAARWPGCLVNCAGGAAVQGLVTARS